MAQFFFEVVSRLAFQELLRSFPVLPPLDADLELGHGLALARDVIAPHDLPPAPRSCMDGFAVAARDVFGASESSPAYLELAGEVHIEQAPDFRLQSGTCGRIPTGGILPRGADAVVMEEQAEEHGGTVEVRKSLAPGDNVMLQAEDARGGEPALRAGVTLRPAEIGLLAALGLSTVKVVRRARVAVISTGNELVPVSATPEPGQVRDVNSPALCAMAREAGASPLARGIVPDRLEDLARALAQALEQSDAVLLSGGSSVGVRDLTIAALKSLPGSSVLAHGVAISPGKPTILAKVGAKPVLGLPGQVASAQVVMQILVQPFLRHLMGHARAFEPSLRPTVRAELARNTASRQGREDYVRVRLEHRPGRPPLAHPVLGKSGLLKTLILAHGLMPIAAESEGLYAGSGVDVLLL